MNHIDIYNNSAIILSKKAPKSIISWTTILFILIIILMIIFSIPFNIYKNYLGYISISDDISYLVLNMNESDFPLNKNNKLYIKDELYDYEIINIKDNKVVLKVKLKDEINIIDNTVIVNVLEKRTTVFNILKNKLKRGIKK